MGRSIVIIRERSVRDVECVDIEFKLDFFYVCWGVYEVMLNFF